MQEQGQPSTAELTLEMLFTITLWLSLILSGLALER